MANQETATAGNSGILKELLSSNAAKGVYAGAGIASLFSILRSLALDKERKKIYKDPSESGKGTIMLHLPAKMAKVVEKLEKPPSDKSRSKTCLVSAQVRGPRQRGRRKQTKFEHAMTIGSNKEKRAGLFQTRPYREAIDVLKFFAGGAAGYAAVKHVYNKAAQRQLARDEEAARNEFLDMIGERGADKYASSDAGMSKEAMGIMSYIALLSLLGTGGSAYAAKHILDNSAREDDDAGYRPPRINRIVIKSRKPDEEDQLVDEKTAQLAVIDKIAELTDSYEAIITEDVVKTAAADGFQDFDAIRNTLRDSAHQLVQRSPDTANKLITNAVRERPSLARLGFLDRLPPRMKAMAMKLFEKALGVPYVGDAMRRRAVNSGVDQFAGGFKTLSGGGTKQAFSIPTSIFTSFLGSTAASRPRHAPQDEERPEDADEAEARADRIILEGADPEAGNYLSANQQRLRQTLQLLIEDGLI